MQIRGRALDEYNEEKVLVAYVINHYGKFFTTVEGKAYRALLLRQKIEWSDSDGVDRKLEAKVRAVETPDVLEALHGGREAFEHLVYRRIMEEHGDEVFVNRCPECNRVVRTPLAKQCQWCHFDWH
jgi:hypothetical protein